MKKVINLVLLLSVVFIITSCFSKQEEEKREIEVKAPDYTISSGTGGGGGIPSPQGGNRK